MVDKSRFNTFKFNNSLNKSNLDSFAIKINNELKTLAPIIAIEELSELIHATSKWMRFDRPGTNNSENKMNDDKLHLIEEIADATIALHIIKNMANINQNDINKMIAYKLDRKNKFLSNGTMINKINNKNCAKRDDKS